MATKWGVFSAGKICNDFVVSVQSLNSDEHTFVAVAARQLKAAQDFAKLHNISKAYGSYEELAKDPDVEVVYIGTINPAHLSAAKLMLEHGKHILMEKPFTLNTKQTEEVFSLAKQKKLFAMEALWSRFLPSYEFVFDQINKGVIGDIYHVNAIMSFGAILTDEQRKASKELGGGTVLDLGVYTINIVEQLFGGETPEKIVAVGHLNKNGVDLDFSAALQFKNNRTATMSTQSMVGTPNEAIIFGTKGIIKIGHSFNAATKVYVNDTLYEFEYPKPIQPLIYGGTGLCYQAMEVRKCLKAGQLESHRMSHTDSVTISKIQDEIRKQIGVKFDADN